MKEVTVIMNAQITKIIKNVPSEKDSLETGGLFKSHADTVLKDAGFDDVLIDNVKVFEI